MGSQLRIETKIVLELALVIHGRLAKGTKEVFQGAVSLGENIREDLGFWTIEFEKKCYRGIMGLGQELIPLCFKLY